MTVQCYFCGQDIELPERKGDPLSIEFHEPPADGAVEIVMTQYACRECFGKLDTSGLILRQERDHEGR
jgi:hypothetical protein